MGVSNKLFFLCSFVLYSNLSFSLESNNLHSHKIDSSFFSFLFSSDVQSLPTFRIGLLLPFCNEKNDSLHNLNIDSILSNNSSNIEPYKFYKKSSISIDFMLLVLFIGIPKSTKTQKNRKKHHYNLQWDPNYGITSTS